MLNALRRAGGGVRLWSAGAALGDWLSLRLKSCGRRRNAATNFTWNGADDRSTTRITPIRAALRAMIACADEDAEAKRRIVIAGEMLELGGEGVALHAECGFARGGSGD